MSKIGDVKIYDATLPVSPSMLTWPGDPPVSVRRTSDLERGDSSTVSELIMGSHTGTHVDAPAHFVPGGYGVDRIPVSAMFGEAYVADARGLRGELSRDDLAGLNIPAATTRLLIKSDNSRLWEQPSPAFPDSYVCLSPGAAQWCVERGMVCVGVDFLSVEQKGSPGHPTHVTLLQAGIAIIEGLDLRAVEPGFYELVCLPLRITGCDGSPARVLLIRR